MRVIRLRVYKRSQTTRRFGKPLEVFLSWADVDRLREALRLALTREPGWLSSLGETRDGVAIDVAPEDRAE